MNYIKHFLHLPNEKYSKCGKIWDYSRLWINTASLGTEGRLWRDVLLSELTSLFVQPHRTSEPIAITSLGHTAHLLPEPASARGWPEGWVGSEVCPSGASWEAEAESTMCSEAGRRWEAELALLTRVISLGAVTASQSSLHCFQQGKKASGSLCLLLLSAELVYF